MKGAISIALLVALMGCATVKSNVQSPMSKVVNIAPRKAPVAPTEVYQASLAVQPTVIGEPAMFTLHAWFMEGTNFPATDAWTNDWQFLGVMKATNVLTPSNEWTFVPMPMEIYKGHLGFSYQGTEPNAFLRSKLQIKGDS